MSPFEEVIEERIVRENTVFQVASNATSGKGTDLAEATV
jgi:hypothetical protein